MLLEVEVNSTEGWGSLRPRQPLNLMALGPDRNAHLVILLGNLLSLKIVWQNISANGEGSHTAQSCFGDKCGILPGSQKTNWVWGWWSERKGETKKHLDLIC